MYASPVASAQVKSALLLAGLLAAGETSVTEPEHLHEVAIPFLNSIGYMPTGYDPRTGVETVLESVPYRLFTECFLGRLDTVWSVGEIARALGPEALVFEYGAGSARKTARLLATLERPAGYVAADVAVHVTDLDGTPEAIPERLLAVFLREDGAWRVVQLHLSVGAAE